MPEQSVILERFQEILHEDGSLLEHQLKLASLQIMLFECFRQTLHQRLESFLGDPEWKEKGPLTFRIRPEYKYLFNNIGHPKFEKQLRWFQDSNAITSEEADFVQEQRKRRNEISHRFFTLLVDSSKTLIDAEDVKRLMAILVKVDNWWIREIEVATDPDAYEEDVDIASSLMTELLNHFVEKACKATGNDV